MNASWVYMEVATIAAAALALRFFPFPFIVMVASVALWFLSMDLALLLLHRQPAQIWEADWDFRRNVSMVFGVAMIAVAWAIDVKWARLGDFGFWLHLFGALTFWGALSSGSGDAIGKAVYCAINVGLVALAVFLGRRVYAVVGAIGICAYLGYLAADAFKDVLAFSFALSAIGLAVIFAGVWLQRRQRAISAFLDAALPPALRALRPARASAAKVAGWRYVGFEVRALKKGQRFTLPALRELCVVVLSGKARVIRPASFDSGAIGERAKV